MPATISRSPRAWRRCPTSSQTTRSFAGGKPYWLFPTAIAMRQNPYGAAPAENPAGGRVAMARTDPREHALIGAAWYAGYLAHAARAGLEAVTLAAVAGPSGVVTPAGLAPSYHVLRGLAALRNAAVLASRSSAPRDVQVLAARTTAGPQLWLVNLTDRTQRVRVQATESALRDATVVVVGEDCIEQLSVDADGLSRHGSTHRRRPGRAVGLRGGQNQRAVRLTARGSNRKIFSVAAD